MKREVGGGDLMTTSEFVSNCEAGAFVDYDGFGYYADEEGRHAEELIMPSDVLDGRLAEGKTHVLWFNR